MCLPGILEERCNRSAQFCLVPLGVDAGLKKHFEVEVRIPNKKKWKSPYCGDIFFYWNVVPKNFFITDFVQKCFYKKFLLKYIFFIVRFFLVFFTFASGFLWENIVQFLFPKYPKNTILSYVEANMVSSKFQLLIYFTKQKQITFL